VFHHILLLKFNEKKGGSREEHLLPLSSSSLFERLALLLLPFFCLRVPVTYKMWAAQTRARACVCPVYCARPLFEAHQREEKGALLMQISVCK